MNQQQNNQPVEIKPATTGKPVVSPVVPTPVAKPEEKPTPAPQDPDDAIDLIPSEPYQSSPLFYEMANYFGIEQRDYENAKNELSVIVDWAIEEGKSNKTEDILTIVRKLEDNILTPGWGERRYSNVYRYLRLASKAQSFKKALAAYEKGGV